MVRGELQPVLAVARDCYLVALLLECVLDAARDGVFVFNDENRGSHAIDRTISRPMSRPILTARPRDTHGKKVSKLRLRGNSARRRVRRRTSIHSQSSSMRTSSQLLHRQTGRHVVLDLKVEGEGKPQPVLLQAVQEHPVSRKPLHIDLLVVNLEEERTVDAPIIIVGHSEAIDKMGGVLLHLRDAVVVRAKPDDLPSGIELNITALDSFEAVLRVSDLIIPAGVTLLTDAAEPVARVQAPRIEEEPIVEAAEGVEVGAPAEAEAAEAAEAQGPETATEESA